MQTFAIPFASAILQWLKNLRIDPSLAYILVNNLLKYDLRYLSLRSSMSVTYPRLFKSEEIQIGKSYWIQSTTKNKVINARDYLLKYANFKKSRFSDQCWIHTITVKTIICDQFWIRRITVENDYFFCSHF